MLKSLILLRIIKKEVVQNKKSCFLKRKADKVASLNLKTNKVFLSLVYFFSWKVL